MRHGARASVYEDRYDTHIDDLWSALTDPVRLARWYGQVDGDLRPGGQFRLYIESADLEAAGRVEACGGTSSYLPIRTWRPTSARTAAIRGLTWATAPS